MRACLSFGLMVLLLLGMSLSGCGPAVSQRDLGTVVPELPKVKGVDEPYPMKELGPAKEHPDDDEMKVAPVHR
jgi:hypothetical protein